MNWNELLYQYAQTHGGQYFGNDLNGSDWNAVLLLTWEDAPLIIRPVAHSAGRGGLFYTVQVLLRCELHRDYILKISRQTVVHGGMNTVRRQLDKVTERFGVDLHDDYGCPEITNGRHIKTDDPEFTRMVFQDAGFRQLLVQWPDYDLSVRKNAPMKQSDRSHIIAVNASPDVEHWSVDVLEPFPTEEMLARAAGNFDRSLEGMIDLAKAAHTAVTAWRMPPKARET